MNLDKIIAELRNEVQSITEAITALERLLPGNSDDPSNHRPKPKKESKA